MLHRSIPSSGQALPVVGLGTWQAFDVSTPVAYENLHQVISVMHEHGGRLIDSSPMYGRAEEVVGTLTKSSGIANDFFYATKVWTRGKEAGIRQMNESFNKLGRDTIDLMQIHNLVDWKIHLSTLKKWKEEGRVKYIGITHYMDSMHDELEEIISKERLDFVQFNYSIISRNAEKRLLPAAAHYGVAILINRPFGEGSLFSKVRNRNLPSWSKEYDISNWSQFFLKFIIAHPAVSCVIPGTGNPQHAADNMKAGQGRLPDESLRERMAELIKSL